MSNNTGDEDLRDEAKERMEEMPAETALGNADPAGGSDEDPEDYEAEYGHEGGS
jgi:hypothetical protein